MNMPTVSRKIQGWVAIAVGVLALLGVFHKWNGTLARVEAVERLSDRLDWKVLTDRFNWLEEQVIRIEKNHGTDPNQMPGDTGDTYRRYKNEYRDIETALQRHFQKGKTRYYDR